MGVGGGGSDKGRYVKSSFEMEAQEIRHVVCAFSRVYRPTDTE